MDIIYSDGTYEAEKALRVISKLWSEEYLLQNVEADNH